MIELSQVLKGLLIKNEGFLEAIAKVHHVSSLIEGLCLPQDVVNLSSGCMLLKDVCRPHNIVLCVTIKVNWNKMF